MNDEPKNIVEASATTAGLPGNTACSLTTGQKVTVRRLSWMQFEDIWGELAGLLGVLAGNEDDSPEALAGKLAGAPKFVIRLAALATARDEIELQKWAFDDVLEVATCALRLNFISSAGVRSFFGALSMLGADE